MQSTNEILTKGMNCLITNLGVLDAEAFVSAIMRERFDYTKWQNEYFASVSSEEFNQAAVAYEKEHPLF